MRRIAFAIVLAACSQGDRGPKWKPAGHATPRDGGTLRFATQYSLRNLDPAIEADEVTSYAVHAMYDTLVDYEQAARELPTSGLVVVPHLAEKWDISPDGLHYTFVLRGGITYADGTPIVAADFVTSLERVLAMADSPFGAFIVDIDGAQAMIDHKAQHATGLRAPDAHTLDITLTRPNGALLEILTMSFATPLRADYLTGVGDQLRRKPLVSGPFAFDHWDEGRSIVLRKNAHYWDAAHIHLDGLELVENIPRDTQFLMFERGELDTAERLAAPDYLWVMAQPAWAPYVQHRAVMNAYGSRMNVTQKPFDDRRVRQALNYAVNKQHTLKLLNGAAVPSHGILPPGLFGRDDTLQPYPHDPAKARALLAEAGYPNGFDTEYVVMADDEAERLATSLQSDLAEVGVRVHITLMSFPTYLTAIGSRNGPAFSKGTWIADYPDPTDFLDARFHTRMIADENSNNDSFYSNPKLDAVLDAARGEPDRDKRAAMYHSAERILYDDAPWIWEYHQLMTEVIQPYVSGYSLHPIWMRDYAHAWLDLDDHGERVPR